eukprot:3394001-Pyramimonas_sp.AAC.1
MARYRRIGENTALIANQVRKNGRSNPERRVISCDAVRVVVDSKKPLPVCVYAVLKPREFLDCCLNP